MKRIAIFCGSSPGSQPVYRQAAIQLGQILARHHIEMVYGGGSVGLMGAASQAALEAGGVVTGVITRALYEMEVAHHNLSMLHVVDTMHQRKALMAELADGFIALPGGIGTLEEIFEVLVWTQLNIHAKPCALLNVAGYFDHLTAFLDHMNREQFIRPEHHAMLLVDDDPAQLLDRMRSFRLPQVDKAAWVRSLKNASDGNN